MLISEPYYVFPYVYWFLSKTTKYDGNTKNSFPEHVAEFFFACFYAHARVMTQSEEPWRNRAGNHRLKRIHSLQVIGVSICDNYTSTIASIDGEDFTV